MISLAPVPLIVAGPGSRAEAGAIAARVAPERGTALLVADPGIASGEIAASVAASLAAAGFDVAVFRDFAGDPTTAQTDAAAAAARAHRARVVVGLGGGSALDLAKTAAAIAGDTAFALAYQLCARPFPQRRLPFVAIPTTAGTGSELTRVAVLTRPDKAKTWLWDDALRSAAVILDPATTVSLPPHLTAATGLDALVHAIEAATNRNANAFADLYALEAVRLAARRLLPAVRDGADLAAREGLQRAAALAGIAIDNCGTAVAHNIGHALGSLARVHHGRAVALGMMATLTWNCAADNGRFAAVAEAMGVAGGAPALPAAFEALVRASGVEVSLARDCPGLSPETLAAQMARPENASMRNANARRIEDADLLRFAQRLLVQH